MERVELHCHTSMSKMDSVINPKRIVEYVKLKKLRGIAITDYGNVYAHRIVQGAMQNYDEKDITNIKVIYGTEIEFVDDMNNEKTPVYHVMLLVVDLVGFSNLHTLISLGGKMSQNDVNPVKKSELYRYREGLLLGAPCEQGEIYYNLAEGTDWTYIKEQAKFYDYLELQPKSNDAQLLMQNEYSQIIKLRDVQEINKEIVKLGQVINIPVVAISNAHYLQKEDVIARKVLKYVEKINDDDDGDFYIRTTHEMLQQFSYLGEENAYEVVVKNTNVIADLIHVDVLKYKRMENRQKHKLREFCKKRVQELYGSHIPENIEKRLDLELDLLEHYDYDDLFLSHKELIEKVGLKPYQWGENSIVGTMYISYLLGMIENNPADKSSVSIMCPYFSTGIEGEKLPFFQMNLPMKYQRIVLELAGQLEEKTEAFMARNIIFLEKEEIVLYIQGYLEEKQIKLDDIEKENLCHKLMKVVKEVGIDKQRIFVNKDERKLVDYFPISMVENHGNVAEVVNYELYDSFDETNIMENKSYNFISLLAKTTGYSPCDISFDDHETMLLFKTDSEIYKKYGMNGIDIFEKPEVLDLLEKTQPTRFKELIQIDGICKGINIWKENQEELWNRKMIDFSSLIGTRDDVFDLLMQYGYTENEAYVLTERVRKGKGFRKEDIDYAVKKGIPSWRIQSLNNMKYIIARTDVIPEVMLNWRLAYYKVHYPKVFTECLEQIKYL